MWGEDITGSTFMHELGHSLGLEHHPDGPAAHSFDSYPSTMNYNKPNDYYGFSSGDTSDGIDEWATIVETIPESIPDTTDLPEVTAD